MQLAVPVTGETIPSAKPRMLTIPEIQGLGHISPVEGERVATAGVVTAVQRDGFYLQDRGDGSELTSDAVFIYTGRQMPNVERGNLVWAEGTVEEFARDRNALSSTQISGRELRIVKLADKADLPEALELGKDRPLPHRGIYEAGLAYESMEGMRVRVPGARVIGASNKYGDVYIAPDVEDSPLNVTTDGVLRGSPYSAHPQRLKLTFDPKVFGAESPALNAGDYVGPMEGVLFHGFGFYGIKPVGPVDIRPGKRKPDVTKLEGTSWGMTHASFNLENLDAKVEDPKHLPPGGRPDDDVGSGKLQAIAEQIVKNLKSPDLLSLQEIQDNDGSEDRGVTDASKTWEALIEAIVAAGGPRYEWADSEPRAANEDGGQPGGNIRVGFLYNPKRVELDRASLTRVGEDEPGFEGGRKSLSSRFTFKPTGKSVHVINNHWASKYGSTPTYRNPNMPEIIGGEAERKAQQEVIGRHVGSLLRNDPAARILSVGDFNAPEYEAPLLAHGAGALFNLGDTVPDSERYSYVFQGIAEAIDHQFGSRNLADKVEFEYVHINSPFAKKATDHDPNISRIDMR